MSAAGSSWETASGSGPGSQRRTALLAGGAVALVVLATVGFLGGWMLADGSGGDPGAQAPAGITTGPERTNTPSEPSRVERTPAAPTTGPKKPAPAGKFEVPDLVGLDFVAARAELRKRNLGWQIVFHESGSDRSVVSTDPPAGHTVRRGVTVKLMVAGAAPPVRVPDVAGDPCAKAANRLIDEGLYPDYSAERAGRVIRQEPEPGADLRWNDRVEIYCGKAPAVEPSTAPPA